MTQRQVAPVGENAAWNEIQQLIEELAIAKAKEVVQLMWRQKLKNAIEAEVDKLKLESAEEIVKSMEEPNLARKRKLGLAPIVHKEHVPLDAVHVLDEIFLGLLRDYTQAIMAHARASTEFILKVSGNFLGIKAQTALNDFHSLYFGAGRVMNQASVDVNKEVDIILKSIRDLMDQRGEVEGTKIIENEKDKIQRLSISGLQKQLEMIISLDEGIREKLIPILSSMQFEDMLTHRLQHIVYIWEKVIEFFRSPVSGDPAQLTEELKEVPTSQSERRDFYLLVLGQEPPAGINDKQSIFDILF